MYQTPATHRILTKEGIEVNAQEKLISLRDEHFVFICPKQIVNSSGTTWANETHRLCCEFPDSFEVKGVFLLYSYSVYHGLITQVFCELYLESLKDECAKRSLNGQPCTFVGWISPPMIRIPRPVSDVTKLPDYHTKMCLNLAQLKVMRHALLMTGNLDITSKKCLTMEV